MKNKILWLLIFILTACQPRDKSISSANLILLDSIPIEESNGFLAAPDNYKLVGDSLLAIGSTKNSGICFFNLKNGKELGSILSKNLFETQVFPSYFSVDEFPIVYVLNGLASRVLTIRMNTNVENSNLVPELQRTIRLTKPTNFFIYPINGYLSKMGDNFLVSMGSSQTPPKSQSYFKNSEYLFGEFNLEGDFKNFNLSYPKILLELKKPILPYKHYAASQIKKDLLIVFPADRTIKKYHMDSTNFFEIIIPKSKFTDFEPKYLERELQPIDDIDVLPQSSYFNTILEDSLNIYLQTMIPQNDGKWQMKTGIMRYNKLTESWIESDNIYDFENLGGLTGVIGDTLYFVDAGMIKKNEKYIKRAILKQIED